jgi:alpha-beta hydrolase superfamily lysophospholipase
MRREEGEGEGEGGRREREGGGGRREGRKPASPPVALLLIVHGLNDYSGRYAGFADF